MILDNAFKPDLRVKKEIETITKMGFYIDLICWDQDSDLENFEDLRSYSIHRIKLKVEKQIGVKKLLYLYKFFTELKKYLSKNKTNYDYVYVHDFLMLPIGVYFKSKLKNKLVYDAHEIYHLMEWEKYPFVLGYFIYAVERYLIKKADFFIVVSEYRKKFYSEKLKREINVIGNWYDEYKGNSIDLRKKFSIDNSKIIIAYFGVINFKVRPINKIFDFVTNSNNIHFVIGGAGVDQEYIKDLTKNAKNITYLGWLDNVREYMDSIDYLIYFMNSNRKYFFYTAPNSLYLAISHSKPLITNVPGEPQDLIEKHGIGICLNEIEDFSKMVMPNTDEFNKMVLNIDKIKDRFIWSESEKVYNKFFNLGN